MMYQAKNGSISIDQAKMHYISYGIGKRTLIILPGLGDGLRTVKGSAIPFAWDYRIFARDYKVYVFSRREPLQQNCSIKGMAEDIKIAMDQLNIGRADFLGVSMGGLISQQFALLYPERLGKLVLAVTALGDNETLHPQLLKWMDMAREDRYKDLMSDIAEEMYQEKYLKAMRLAYPAVASLTKPKSFDRFLFMSQSILDAEKDIPVEEIQAATLVIGARKDKVAGVEGSLELFHRIPNCKCHIYEDYGHGVYEEAEDFKERVLEFLKR